MAHIIEIDDLSSPELEVYAGIKDAQLKKSVTKEALLRRA